MYGLYQIFICKKDTPVSFTHVCLQGIGMSFFKLVPSPLNIFRLSVLSQTRIFPSSMAHMTADFMSLTTVTVLIVKFDEASWKII